MNASLAASAQSNPFSTRQVRPGALPYLFRPPETLDGLLCQLAAHSWWGEIVGPHGSGKSSLLASLLQRLERTHRTAFIALHDGQRRLPVDLRDGALTAASAREPVLIVVDGYEQLGWWSRRRLRSTCQRRGWGLLVSAHQSVGLPRLFETAPSLELAHAVVEQVLAGAASPVTPPDVERHYQQARGNLREMLFGLYDLHEDRRQGRALKHGSP